MSGRFHSILLEQPSPPGEAGASAEPSCFPDLNLDQVVPSVTAGREEYDLAPFFHAPLRDASAVRYRHEILRDLEKRDIAEAIGRFAQAMRRRREQLALSNKLHYTLQKQRLFLDAADTYGHAVRSLAEELRGLDLNSRGLQALREFVDAYAGSAAFTSLTDDTQAVKDALASVRYCVHISGHRVTASRYEDQADYSAEVEQTFAKFKQGVAKDYRVEVSNYLDMNHVEARILSLVAELHPRVFGALDEFCSKHRSHLDPTLERFDREVQFYLAYLEHVERLRSAGLPFCYPEVSTSSKDVFAEDAFDLALATKIGRRSDDGVVCNDVELSDPERVIVVTGPNQGGKTTFARMFGQLHYLASLGFPVPARRARLFLPDAVFTHFERKEELENLRGKLEDDLLRIREILDRSTSESVIVLNESFTSTTLEDARAVGTAVMTEIIDRDALCVCVTFVDELAFLGESVVSMVGTVLPEDPTIRTFKILRQPADGLAYAAAIADKYGLGYSTLRRRLSP